MKDKHSREYVLKWIDKRINSLSTSLETSKIFRWHDKVDAIEQVLFFWKGIKSMLQPVPEEKKTKIICLCGSTRFTELMMIKQWELTKQGYIVLSWCALPDSYFQGDDKAHIGDQEGVKEIVDEVHMRKIDLADEVFILNVDGYIGESTRNELNYARKQGKAIRFLEPEYDKLKESADEK